MNSLLKFPLASLVSMSYDPTDGNVIIVSTAQFSAHAVPGNRTSPGDLLPEMPKSPRLATQPGGMQPGAGVPGSQLLQQQQQQGNQADEGEINYGRSSASN